MAAAAAISKMRGHGLHLHRTKSHPHNEAECRKEKDFIAHYTDTTEVLSPQQISQDPRNKELGTSSRSLSIKDFELVKILGTGTFARVWLARLASGPAASKDKVYALKILRKADIVKLKQVEHVQNERRALSAVAGHPFITTLITTFSDHDCLYMLLDYCPGGEIFTYLRRAGKFDEPTARFYAAEIVLILEYLHENQGVAYRDMKPENILLDADGHLKLVDFGFAKKVDKSETYTLCGTPEYLAPEVIHNKGHGTAVDWWAFGILLYEFLVGQPPFWDSAPMKIYRKISDGVIEYPDSLSQEAKSLIGAVCVVNPHERLGNTPEGVKGVKEHAFFKGKIDFEKLYYRKCKGPIIPRVKGPADASNFDTYDEEKPRQNSYTKEMAHQYEDAFKSF